jgi:AcrR family transcriptional regulator
MASTRDKIVKAASALFYREGIRAVSVDRIAEKAGITKRSLYYHFKSKDDLIAAYLEARDQPNLAAFEMWFGEASGDAADKVAAIFTRLGEAARSPRWRGCGFLRTSAELAATPGHPAIRVAVRHKRQFEHWLAAALTRHGLASVDLLARQIRLLIDGGFAVVLLSRDSSYMATAGLAAEALVRAQIESGHTTP